MRVLVSALVSLVVFLPFAPEAFGQWTNRYPKVDGYSHHVYLEGFELPTLTSGPMDPAPSPDGSQVAFSARGWIWILDVASGVAQQVTTGPGMDARPTWSPDGSRIAFVRDDTRDTDVVLRDVASGTETTVVETEAIDLDPQFGPDGRTLYYTSGTSGSIELWRVDLETGERTQLTENRRVARSPQPTRGGVVFLEKTTGVTPDRLVHLALENGAAGARDVLRSKHIASQSDLSVAPDGRTVAVTWPTKDGFELRLIDAETPTSSIRLASDVERPLAPAFSADGAHVWFARPTPDASTALYRVPTAGGPSQPVAVTAWEWAEAPGTLRIRTRIDGAPAAARLNVSGSEGHPAVPDAGMIRFDGQSGRVFFYSPGVIEVTVPPGPVTVSAVQGLATPEAQATVDVASGTTEEVVLDLQPVWNAREAGWASGDHHFHLNYGGPYVLTPTDIALDMKGEGVDVGNPLLANLHDRFLDQQYWRHRDAPGTPIIEFGQEIRSHFLGHVKLLGTKDLFWPWVWGPYYEVYGRDDRPNAEALQHARGQGGIGGYVHPVSIRDPLGNGNAGSVPIGLIPDAVLGEVDVIEVGCMWTDEIGTAAVWHQLLNLGLPVTASAGSDVMNNYYRTMAIGATRAYVRHDGAPSYRAHLDGLKAGRSFVTNGPMLEFEVGGAGPGETTAPGATDWTLSMHSAVPVDTVEVFVNGEAVWQSGGVEAAGTRTYDGTLTLPEGGWVTVRARGGATGWPMMDSYPFAETNPVWIGSVGSTDPDARRQAAETLRRLLDVAEGRLVDGYGEADIPTLRRHFDAAREMLVMGDE